jgi:hypothetical protein
MRGEEVRFVVMGCVTVSNGLVGVARGVNCSVVEGWEVDGREEEVELGVVGQNCCMRLFEGCVGPREIIVVPQYCRPPEE